MSKDETNSNTESQGATLTAEALLDRLKKALQKSGDFPASAKIVTELRMLTSSPNTTANQLTEVILKEPSLGARVLHLVNSSFYQRAKPIMTVSQAVIQIGMKPLAELCAGLVLLKKFIPHARKGGPFAICLQKTIITSLLSSSLVTEENKVLNVKSESSETGYLAGSIAELGTLLLAYYFPQIYESAFKRSQTQNKEIGKCIEELTGITTLGLSLAVVEALNLPEFYKDILAAADSKSGQAKAPTGLPPMAAERQRIANSVRAAGKISQIVVFNKDKQSLDKALSQIEGTTNLDLKKLDEIVGKLPEQFKDHCSTIEVNLPALPEFVKTYDEKSPGQSEGATNILEVTDFGRFLDEIRQSIKNCEPTASIITSVMETLAWGLKFDRVLLCLVDSQRTKLLGRMLLGQGGNFDPRSFSRSLLDSNSHAPDLNAFKSARPVFTGDPIFEDAWPLVAIPIGFGDRAIGIIYADRLGEDDTELNDKEQAAMSVLAELLDQSVSLNG